MPIEIKELHIKAVVSPPTPVKQGHLDKEAIAKLKTEISAAVTRSVLQIMKHKTER
ncbi:DUF5908 family protein [Parapedobacter sp. DT-150]|uniref:DUF5908 family protein n=1 Tax=Parapedobacter sp. DT-150 TaxID=3396162 RepID=UPI003F1CE546